MSGGTLVALVGGVASALIFVLVIAVAAGYNRLVRLREQVDSAWSPIDAQLRRRYDLVPVVVNTIGGYLTYDRRAIAAVVEAREDAMAAVTHAAGTAARAEAEALLDRTLGRLIELGAAYPEVRGNPSFGALHAELRAGADRIAYGRRLFNEAVEAYNTAVRGNLVASMTGFRTRDFFQAAEADPRATTRLSLGR
ncbi:MAG: LemA family protein [Actinoplanes sp.]